MFRTTQYFRLTNEEERHRGFQYKDGLNVDTNKFHPYGQCKQGGLYFFSREEIWKYPSYIGGADKVHWVREVTLPDDAEVHLEDGKRKADRFVLGPRRRFDPYAFFTQNYMRDEKLKAVKQNGDSIRWFVDSATDEMKWEALKQNGYSIQWFVNSATEEMKEIAEANK